VVSQQEKKDEARSDGARDFLGRQGALLKAGFSFSGYERDMVMMNRGDGTFLDISGVSGADSVSDGRGAIYADVDNDGDLDIFLRAMHGPAHFLYENRAGQRNGFLRITLQGRASGPDAYGAVVRLGTPSGTLTRLKSGGSGFLSQPDPRLLFGLGEDPGADWIEVTWPAGTTTRYPGAAAGASLLLVEGEAAVQVLVETPFALPAVRSSQERLEERLTFTRTEALPEITVANLAGEEAPLRDLIPPGGRALVNLWATWCVPCAAEMPELQRLHRESGGRLAVVGLSLDRPEDRSRIAPFLEKLGVTYPVYTVDPAAYPLLFTDGSIPVPLSLLVDEEGRVEALFSGWSRETRRHLRALMKP
jgi:thiol-disulfide isomerase/thioredoxin